MKLRKRVMALFGSGHKSSCNLRDRHLLGCSPYRLLWWTVAALIVGGSSLSSFATALEGLPADESVDVQNCSSIDLMCQYRLVDCSNYYIPVDRDRTSSLISEPRIDSTTPMFIGKDDIFHFLQVTVTLSINPEDTVNDTFVFLLSAKRIEQPAGRNEEQKSSSKCFLITIKKMNGTKQQVIPKKFPLTFRPNEFDFGYVYEFVIVPSPNLSKPKNYFKIDYKMPLNPEVFQDDTECKNYSAPHGNKQASKWYASFLTITKHEVDRSLHVSFIGAPPGFCFEEYVLTLGKGDTDHMVFIPTKKMKPKIIRNKKYLVGEHTFSGLQYNVEYQPVVAAVSESKHEVIVGGKKQRKCLCRLTRLIDDHMAGGCTCIHSEYQTVVLEKLHRVSVPQQAETENSTSKNVPYRTEGGTIMHVALFGAAIVVFSLFGLIYFMFVKFYRQYHHRKIIIHFGLTSNTPNDKMTSFLAGAPLIPKDHTNVLILYSHDSQPHDDAVLELASLLQETLGFNVHIDCWESSEIESNIMDYVSVSTQKADRIIIVNSVGAFKRYESKIEHENRLERINRGPYDELFGLQIDQAFGRQPCILSIRFPYTPSSYILPPLSVSLQYVIPENINLLQTALSKIGSDPVKIDMSSTHMLKMNAAIARMSSFVLAEPDWFEKTHCTVTPSSLQNPESLSTPVKDHSDSSKMTSEEDTVVLTPYANVKTDDVKPIPPVETGDVAYTDVDFTPVDGKLDSGIHTEEEYYNSESMSSVKATDFNAIVGKTEDLLRDCGNTLIIDKGGPEYIKEVKGIDVFS